MAHSTEKPDLGKAHGNKPDRGGERRDPPTPHWHKTQARSTGPDNADPSEKGRPHDTGRSGA